MDITETKISLRQCALNELGDNFDLLSGDELANGYCDAEEANNKHKMDGYWSALMLHYWNKIYKWEIKCKSLKLTLEDYVDWLGDCLRDALYYRSWRPYHLDGTRNDKYQENDKHAADRSINFFCKAKRGKEYQKYNKDNRKCNVLTYSIDAQIDDNGDCALDQAGLVTNINYSDGTKELIKYYLDKGKDIEALILDGIINSNCFKEYKVKTDSKTLVKSEFDTRKLVKHLNTIDEKFILTIFCDNYDIDSDKGSLIYDKLKTLNNGKLYKYISKTLLEIKDKRKLLSYLTGEDY